MPAKGLPPAIKVLFALDILLLTAYLINYLMNAPLGNDVSFAIDLDAEGNLPTWYSSVKLFLIAYLILINVPQKMQAGLGSRVAIVSLGLIFLAMSLDEIVRIHEFIGRTSDVLLPDNDRSSSIFPKTGIWMFLLVPPAFLITWISVRRLHNVGLVRDEYGLFLIGLFVFLLSAGGIEILSNYTGGGVIGAFQVGMEEFGELIGATIMLWATYKMSFVQTCVTN